MIGEPRIFLDISIEDMAKKIFLSGTESIENIVHNLLRIFPDKTDELRSFVDWAVTQEQQPTKGGE